MKNLKFTFLFLVVGIIYYTQTAVPGSARVVATAEPGTATSRTLSRLELDTPIQTPKLIAKPSVTVSGALTLHPYQMWARGFQATHRRQCESGGDYTINTGNGFYGAYQFDLQTWKGMGGFGLPSNASADEQDMRAFNLQVLRGSSPWPVCH